MDEKTRAAAGTAGVRSGGSAGVLGGLRFAVAILAGRAVRGILRLRRRNAGTAFPGLVANALAPSLLVHAIESTPLGIVAISGSSGKSTTTKMITAILEAHGKKVFTNASTANIRQGLMSAVLEKVDLRARLAYDIAVLEFDEAHGAHLADRLEPQLVVLTNINVDQVDRFHDPRLVAEMVGRLAQRAPVVVSNGDDALLEEITSTLPAVHRFGVSESVMNDTVRGLGNLRVSAARLGNGTIVVDSGDAQATIDHEGTMLPVALPARGYHYAVDAAAAVAAASVVLGDAFDPGLVKSAFGGMKPVFGRGEILEIGGVELEFVLVQNPSSFQMNIDQLPPGDTQYLFAMGSDVRDPSYLWPVDMSGLHSVAFVSGSLANDLALQLVYQGVEVGAIDTDLGRALDDFVALANPFANRKVAIVSADAMRRARAHWSLV